MDGERGIIGITDFAQSWLGDLLHIDLFEDGSEVEPQGLFGTLETSKVSFELNSPVGGTIIKKNNKLAHHINLINDEPYGGGWMIVLRMRNIHDLANLMDADAYKEYIHKSWGYTEKGVEE